MRATAKVGLVAIGFVAAVLAAFAVVAINVAATSGPAGQASSGMYAFGDALLFLAVFGVAAVPPVGAALFFLRPHRRVWLVLSVAALAIAATGPGAFICHLAAQTADAGSTLHSVGAFAMLRILVAPLFALGFLLAGVFAPSRALRAVFVGATLIEAAVFVCVAFTWVFPAGDAVMF